MLKLCFLCASQLNCCASTRFLCVRGGQVIHFVSTTFLQQRLKVRWRTPQAHLINWRKEQKRQPPPRHSLVKSSGSGCDSAQADLKWRDHTNRCRAAEWNQRRRASTREQRLVWDNLLRRPGRLLALAGSVPAPPPASSPPGRAGVRAESPSAARSNEPLKGKKKTRQWCNFKNSEGVVRVVDVGGPFTSR